MNILLFPPIAFFITFVFVYILFKLITPAPVKIPDDEKNGKLYTYGEDAAEEKAVPNYERFFLFAFFFTLLYAAGLIMATWAFYPAAQSVAPIIIYAASVILILAILFTD